MCHPQKFWVTLGVLPAFWGQGIGRALAARRRRDLAPFAAQEAMPEGYALTGSAEPSETEATRRRIYALWSQLRADVPRPAEGTPVSFELGAPELRTGNASHNTGMLSINAALGFVKRPAWIETRCEALQAAPNIL